MSDKVELPQEGGFSLLIEETKEYAVATPGNTNLVDQSLSTEQAIKDLICTENSINEDTVTAIAQELNSGLQDGSITSKFLKVFEAFVPPIQDEEDEKKGEEMKAQLDLTEQEMLKRILGKLHQMMQEKERQI